MQPIDDPADPRLDRFRGLIDRGDRPDPDCFFVESETAVARLLASPHFTALAVLGAAAHLERLAPACPTYLVTRELLRAVLGFDLHRGVIACAARPPQLVHDVSKRTCLIGPDPNTSSITPIGPDPNTSSIPAIGPVLGASSLAAALAGPRWTVLLVQGLADPANEAADWYDELTDEQRAAIAEGEADVKAGRVKSSADVWKKYGRTPKN